MNKKRLKIITALVLGVLFFCFYYFYAKNGIHHHDFMAHSIFAKELSKLGEITFGEFLAGTKNAHILAYPGWHLGYLFIWNLLSSSNIFLEESGETIIYALSVSAINTICLLVTFIVVEKIFSKYLEEGKTTGKTILFSLMMMFAGPLYVPGIFSGYYLGPKTGNIWHNPTYLIIKPLAIWIFFLYAELFEKYRDRKNTGHEPNKKLVMGSILLCISAFLKPSFFQMFLPGLFVYCVIELVLRRGENFLLLFKIGVSVVPVTIIGIMQMVILGGSSGEGGGIGIGFLRVWGTRTPYWYIALLFSLAFPIFVFIVYKKKIFSYDISRLGICALFSGLLQYMFLYVTKYPEAGDFGWGFSLSIFIIFMVSIINMEKLSKAEKKWVKWRVGEILLFSHVLFGCIYFLNIFKYFDYILPLKF